MLALAAGRLAEAEELVGQALANSASAHSPRWRSPSYRLQRYALCDFRGGLEELEPAIRELVAEHPGSPRASAACSRISTHGSDGGPEAQRALDDLTRDDCAALPFDQEWLYGMSLLAETAALLGDAELRRGPVPVARCPGRRSTPPTSAEAIRGSVSRYLGILARDDGDAGTRPSVHFEDAVAMNARMGARPWLAHTQHDYARMLLARARTHDRESARDRLDQALVTYRELGMETPTAGAVPTTRTGARA